MGKAKSPSIDMLYLRSAATAVWAGPLGAIIGPLSDWVIGLLIVEGNGPRGSITMPPGPVSVLLGGKLHGQLATLLYCV